MLKFAKMVLFLIFAVATAALMFGCPSIKPNSNDKDPMEWRH